MELQTEPKVKTKRLANIELLRILAMMMVVMLHYLGKGNLLPALTGSMDATGYVAWVLEALSIVAVNVYMLISGYFLVESKFKCSRLLELILQVLFYSLLVPLCLMALGLLDFSTVTVYQMLQYVLPTQMLQYWFATAYVLMYLFSPLLSAATHHMGKKQMQVTLALLFLVLSVGKSVLPVHLEMDNKGYDALWFMFVFLIAAYIRRYGFAIFKTKGRSFLIYVGASLGVFGVTMLVRCVYLRFNVLEYFIKAAYDYNHVLNLLAAVALFYGFFYIKIPEGKVSRWICNIAPHTFGVYLLHEQLEIRYRWPFWLGAGKVQSPVLFVLYAFLCVGIVFIVGIIIDMCRSLLFRGVGRMLHNTVILRLVERIDNAALPNSETERQV